MPSLTAALVAFSFSYVLYLLCKGVRRVWFHPLSEFPGPKLAALSEYWEAWWNIGLYKGQCLFELERLHKRYGAAIRMGPNEIHLNDPRFYHELYRVGSKYYKDPEMHKVLGAPTSTVAETDPVKHRIRRTPLEPLFSRQSILRLESMILRKLDLWTERVEAKGNENLPVSMEWALKSLTMDIVTEFSFGKSIGALDDPNFKSVPVRAFRMYLQSLHAIKAFPFVRYLNSLPYFIARRISSSVELGHELEKVTWDLVDNYLIEAKKGHKPSFPTVMEQLLTPIEQKGFAVPSKEGIKDEILTLVSAGNDTTGTTCMVGMFQIINNPEIHARLLEELMTVLPTPDSVAPYTTLEKLPFLSAVINESLRYASPAASRTPRLVPPGGVSLPDGRFIPAGTRIGMAIYLIHHNEALFPNHGVFDPNRWLNGNATTEQLKFLVPFSKGSRACIGINLAYMELYMIMAYIIRRFELRLWNTTERDMEWCDMVIPSFAGEFRVIARKRLV